MRRLIGVLTIAILAGACGGDDSDTTDSANASVTRAEARAAERRAALDLHSEAAANARREAEHLVALAERDPINENVTGTPLAANSPMMVRNTWLLPEPDSPTTPTVSLTPTVNDTSLTALTSPSGVSKRVSR